MALVVSEDPVEQAVLVVSEDPVEPAVQESLAVPVAPQLEPAQVAVELEHGPVVVVLVRGHPRARLAVLALRTKSVTAAHRRDLVPLLEAAEALAVEAETTREPAAAEAAIAWEVADTVAVEEAAVVVVAVVMVAAVAVVVAAEDGDKRTIDGEKDYEDKAKHHDIIENDRARRSDPHNRLPRVGLGRSPGEERGRREARSPRNAPTRAKGIRHAETGGRCSYSSSSEFRCRCGERDSGAGRRRYYQFGRSGAGQKSGDRSLRTRQRKRLPIEIDKQNPNRAILLVGNDDFPLPIPIVKQKGKWFFDTKVGREEILNRRIGANELNAIQICRGFVEAQHEYAEEKHDDSKVNQYAQRIISTPGKHDGLAWQNADGTWGGPVGEEVAKALEQGYTERVKPYHGYYFKVLKGQGPAAPMGEMDFVVGGAMIGGFALAAAPAEYRVTGVQTFIVGPDGVVYEKDLGPDTLKTFQGMDRYNPDKTWKVTEDDVEDDSQD